MGIMQTHNIKKEERNLIYLCDREITTKLVFNIYILDLNKKKKQILELCNGWDWKG